jgi:uncharacterized peroxidase-related enzyme
MAWIEETHEHAAEGTLKEAYARIVRALGRVIPFYRAYSVSPGHLHAHLDFYEKIAKIGVLSTRRKELIAVAVSAENGCRDCTQLHAGFLRAHRVDEAAVAALAADPGRTLADGLVAGPEAVILAYALKLTRSPRSMRAEDVQALRDAGLSEPEVFEVAFLTAYFNYTNRVGEGLGVEPEPLTGESPSLAGSQSLRGLSAIKALDYTVVRVRDMEAMRAFYGRTLRFQLVRELSPNWVEYRIGPNILALAGRFRFVENPTLRAETATVQLAFRVPYEAVDICAAELTAAGTPVLSPPTDQLWRHRTLFFRDPDGNLIEIYADF